MSPSTGCLFSVFLQALREDPDCTAALYNLHTALRMAGRADEAVAFSWRWIRDRLGPGGTPGAAVGRVAAAGSSPAPRDDTVREEDAGGGEKGFLTVVCVRWGDKYGVEYVERLEAGVRRHLRRRHRFVCYTDDVGALREEAGGGVTARPLGTGCGNWRGWWHKAFLFSR